MDIAALIIGTIALILGVVCISLMLAKNFFSTHQVQMVPVDPMKGFMENISQEIGEKMGDQFRELGDPVTDEELEYLEGLKKKKNKHL